MATIIRDRTIPPGIIDPSRRTISNTVMKDTIHMEKYGYETDGKIAIATLTCAPGGGPPFHYHTTYTERFTAIEGDLVLIIGDEEERIVLKPGESMQVPLGKKHRFTAQEDGLPMVGEDGTRKEVVTFRGEVIPAHAGFERSLYIMYGLANDGMANEEGTPKSLVHLSLVARMSDRKFPGVSGMVVNWVGAVLAIWARWTGEEERLLRRYWD